MTRIPRPEDFAPTRTLRQRLKATWSRGRGFKRRYGLRAFVTRALTFKWLRRFHFWPQAPVAVDGARIESPRSRPFGINLIGYTTGSGSMGEVIRSVAVALDEVKVPVAMCDQMAPDDPTRMQPNRPQAKTNALRYNLMISGSEPATVFGWELGPDYLVGHYTIGYWPWENEVFPKGRQNFAYYDEIWTPSTFVQTAIGKVSPIAVHYVPHPLIPMLNASSGRPVILNEIPQDAFIFLFVYSYLSITERKNPDGVIEAFRRAFGPQDNAWLLIKSHFPHAPAERDRLRSLMTGANVRLLDLHLQRPDLEALMSSCDCYVSLHRAEGFGMTMAEAMSLGKPVIATNYSGNTDFMSAENSYLVDYQLAPIGKDLGPFRKEWLWAEPDLDQAAAYMRQVYEDRDAARRVGERARADVEAMLSPAAVGRVIQERLAAIEGQLS